MAKKNTPPHERPTPVAPPIKKASDPLRAIGERTLERNPSLCGVYVTTDGYPFASRVDAQNHAKNLKATEVVAVEKPKE